MSKKIKLSLVIKCGERDINELKSSTPQNQDGKPMHGASTFVGGIESKLRRRIIDLVDATIEEMEEGK